MSEQNDNVDVNAEIDNIRQQMDAMRDILTQWIESQTVAGYAYSAIMFGALLKQWHETLDQIQLDIYEKNPPEAKA